MSETLNLEEIRENINAVDNEIIKLYEKRLALCDKVAEYKKSTGKAVEISSGRNKFFGAVFAKAAAADGLSAGNAVISKKRISKTFDFI